MTILRWIRPSWRIQGQVPSTLTMPRDGEVSPLPPVAEIHALHADFVWRSLQRLGVPAADLEDALQEVFIVVHRRLQSFDQSSLMTTWLFGICLRVASAQRKRAHVRYERTGAAPDWLESLEDERRAEVPNPEQAALEREQRVELEALLDSLDPVRRASVVMFEIEGMSAPEIATLTGVPVNTVYSRLASAREKLKSAALRARQRERPLLGRKGER
jgi:RNA polymerase sigma-70 factor (ECF subfamily)